MILNTSPSLESLVFLRSLENIPLKCVHRSGYLRWPNIQALALGKHIKIHRYVWKTQTSGSKTKRIHQYFPPNQCPCLTNCTNSSPKAPSPSYLPGPSHAPTTTQNKPVWVGGLHKCYAGALLLTLYLHEKHIQQQPFPVCRVGMNQITPCAAAMESNSIWHCVRIYYGIKAAKLSCCVISNPVTLRLEVSVFPTDPSPSLSIKVPHTHTHTHAVPDPKPETFTRNRILENLKATWSQLPSVLLDCSS